MKKLIFLLSVFTLLPVAESRSQTFGIKGGGNIAMLNKATETDAVLYFHTGLYLRQSLEKWNSPRRYFQSRFFFQPELVYSRQGGSLPDDDLWYKNDYVNLGLIFQYRPVKGLKLEFGPQAGYMVVSDITTKWIGKKEKCDCDWYSGMNFRKMDYSLVFGIVYETGFFADFGCRYNLGLNDVLRNNHGKSVRNGVFQLSMLIDLF